MQQNISIYVHIPFCKARCNYCAFCSCCNFSLVDSYINALTTEIQTCPKTNAVVKTIFIGGGTPSSIGVNNLEKVIIALENNFDLSNITEFSVECNPESVTVDLLKMLKSHNVNRLSFGLQSANDSTLKEIGRIHNYSCFLQAFEMAQRNGFTNINADLIIGLPESENQFYNTVETVSNLPLTHISLYALELYDGSALAKKYPNGIFTDDQMADMYDKAFNIFAQKGFNRYEVSNFSKDGYECKHNINYWQEGSYYGFGASAHRFVNNERSCNTNDIERYCQCLSKINIDTTINNTNNFANKNIANSTTQSNLQQNYDEFVSKQSGVLYLDRQQVVGKDQADEFVMLSLRLQKGFSLSYFKERFDCNFLTSYKNANKLISQGFLVVENDFVRVAQDKFYVLNSILVELL